MQGHGETGPGTVGRKASGFITFAWGQGSGFQVQGLGDGVGGGCPQTGKRVFSSQRPPWSDLTAGRRPLTRRLAVPSFSVAPSRLSCSHETVSVLGQRLPATPQALVQSRASAHTGLYWTSPSTYCPRMKERFLPRLAC